MSAYLKEHEVLSVGPCPTERVRRGLKSHLCSVISKPYCQLRISSFPMPLSLWIRYPRRLKVTCFVLALKSRMPKLPGSPEKGVWSAMMGDLERAIVSDH